MAAGAAADLASNHGTAAPSRKPTPPERNGPAMNRPDSTEHRMPSAEELVRWTGRERLRFLWYRLRLTVSEMNYASRRMVELQTRLPAEWPSPPPAASKKALPVRLPPVRERRIEPPDSKPLTGTQSAIAAFRKFLSGIPFQVS